MTDGRQILTSGKRGSGSDQDELVLSVVLSRILSRHHCPRDPMRLPSACATSVPFRARYQFSRGFSLRGENDYIWKFLGGFSF